MKVFLDLACMLQHKIPECAWWCHRSQSSRHGEGGSDVGAEGAQLPGEPREHREPAGGVHRRRWAEPPHHLVPSREVYFPALDLFITYRLIVCCMFMYWPAAIARSVLTSCGERKPDIGPAVPPAVMRKRDAVWLVAHLLHRGIDTFHL